MNHVRRLLAGALVAAASILVGAPGIAAAADLAFREDFSRLPVGDLPDSFLVIEGGFAVKEEDGNRFIELPGAPLETYSVMFGPAHLENWSGQARFHATLKGRKFPVFGLSLNGAGGYRLRVVPAKKAVELVKGDNVLAQAPFDWESGSWTLLRIQLRKSGDAAWTVEGKAWKEGTPEPATWMVTWQDTQKPIAGRAAIWGLPFAGTPIRFDDLQLSPSRP